MPYNLYQVEFQAQDEDLLPEERHMALFLELQPDSEGTIYQVVGSLWEGYKFLISDNRPADTDDYLPEQTVLIGQIEKEDVAKLEDICRAAKVPGRQMAGFRRMRPGEELETCRTWVGEVLGKIREEGLVK